MKLNILLGGESISSFVNSSKSYTSYLFDLMLPKHPEPLPRTIDRIYSCVFSVFFSGHHVICRNTSSDPARYSTGWGKSSLPVVSTRNTAFILLVLLSIVLFPTTRTVNQLLPHPVFPALGTALSIWLSCGKNLLND